MSDFPDALLTAVRNRRVVPFVGAGLSLTVGRGLFPSWGGLIEQFAVRLEAEAMADAARAVRHHAAAGDLVEAAEVAVRNLTKPHFLDEMRKAFDRPRPVNANLTAVGAVWRLRPPFVITTNFERVLEWPLALPDAVPYDAPLPPAVVVHNDDAALLEELDHLTAHDPPRIWHLHGSVRRPDTIILTTSQFERLYGALPAGGDNAPAPAAAPRPEYRFALERLRHLLATRPLLFLGFSLGDPFVLHHLREVLSLTLGNRPVSYLFVKAEEKDAAKLLQDLQVQAIEFPDFGEPMLARLEALVAAARPDAARVVLDQLPPALAPLASSLEDALAGLVPDPALVADAFNASRPQGWAPFAPLGDGVLLLKTAIERLARAPVQRASSGAWPLLSFVARLQAALPQWKDALDGWIDSALRQIARDDAERARIRRSLLSQNDGAINEPPYVLVRILDEDAQRWTAQAWLFPAGPASIPVALFPDERSYAPTERSLLVRDLMLELVARRVDQADPVIAFLLPRTLLWEHVDSWRPEPEPSFEPALGTSFAVTVRPLQRDLLTQQYVRRFWEDLRKGADASFALVDLEELADSADGRAVWLGPDAPAVAATVRKLRQCGVTCVVVATPPPTRPGDAASRLFDVVLSAGIPVVLWTRHADPVDPTLLRTRVAELVGDAPFLELPRRLRALRASEEDAGTPGIGSYLGLIWDAAEYLPPDYDPDNRATI